MPRDYVEYQVGRATRLRFGEYQTINLTLFEDAETGILVTDKEKFEAFIQRVSAVDSAVVELVSPYVESSDKTIDEIQKEATSGSSGRKRTTGGSAG